MTKVGSSVYEEECGVLTMEISLTQKEPINHLQFMDQQILIPDENTNSN